MTIRYLLFLTALTAAVSVVWVSNWAIGAFLAAAALLLASTHLRGNIPKQRTLRRSAVLSAVVLVYTLAVGPALAIAHVCNKLPTSVHETKVVGTMFPMQARVIDSVAITGAPNGNSLTCDIIADYVYNWRRVGGTCRRFLTVLRGEP
ncbi:hypothetical protein Poly59_30400 [Rubripirellula reticaptiva]|uniref:Uncharacterized protein n=1 Tax=Rubripirellula reticaptiva TaxID=2528013 RepID=A0A5C6ER87_9BACT|nr:hypothetical protein Poly59_30400 [Rubripirellula reticaptiva]